MFNMRVRHALYVNICDAYLPTMLTSCVYAHTCARALVRAHTHTHIHKCIEAAASAFLLLLLLLLATHPRPPHPLPLSLRQKRRGSKDGKCRKV